jgi:hypothetical protein
MVSYTIEWVDVKLYNIWRRSLCFMKSIENYIKKFLIQLALGAIHILRVKNFYLQNIGLMGIKSLTFQKYELIHLKR